MNVPTYILNYKAVVDFYGHWPLFHDAQVPVYVASMPESQSLAFTLHTWQMTSKVDAKGFVSQARSSFVSRFDGVPDPEMNAFASGNILFGMRFSATIFSSFRVVLDSVMDMSGSFWARKGEIASMVPAPDGHEA